MATLSLKLGEGLGILLPQLDLNPEVLVHLIPAICAGGYSNSISLLTLTPLLTTPDSAQKRTCHKNSCHYMLAHIVRSDGRTHIYYSHRKKREDLLWLPRGPAVVTKSTCCGYQEDLLW